MNTSCRAALLAAALLLASCSVTMPDIKTVEAIHSWVVENIEYVPDTFDSWQFPQRTLERGAGDCEDSAILIAYLCKRAGIDCRLVIYRNISERLHMAAEIDGLCYSGNFPYPEVVDEWRIKWRLTLDEALALAVIR